MENIKQIVSIISSIFVIIIITKIVEFLKSVPSCQCAKIADTGILDKIVFLEKSIIGLMVIQILRKVYELYSPIKIDKIAKMNSPLNLIIFAVAFLIYVFFIYNVNNFKDSLAAAKNSKESCECVDKWEKTALYIQAIIYMIVVSVILILGIFLVNISLKQGTTGNFTNVMILLIFSVVGLGIWSLYGGDMNVFLEYAMDVIPQSKEGFDCSSRETFHNKRGKDEESKK
jgi:hypothetical protein